MAKVVGPLGSFSASGKVGKALVYFSHLGRNVVRALVTPANPQTESQGGVRLLLGALGRSAKIVVSPSDWLNDIRTITPAGQTWVSHYISQTISLFGSGATGVTALNSALSGHTAAADWATAAETAGLTDVIISYAGTTDTITGGAQLYALAAYTYLSMGANPALFDRAPYSTELASWTSTEIAAFVADMQAET